MLTMAHKDNLPVILKIMQINGNSKIEYKYDILVKYATLCNLAFLNSFNYRKLFFFSSTMHVVVHITSLWFVCTQIFIYAKE